jgi:hypothetical protein
MISRDVLKKFGEIQPGTHSVLVYDPDERKEDALFTHMKLGWQHDGLVYACSEEIPPQAKTTMRKFGIEVDRRERDGTLMVETSKRRWERRKAPFLKAEPVESMAGEQVGRGAKA